MTLERGRALARWAALVAVSLAPLLVYWPLWGCHGPDRLFIPEGDFSSQYYPLRYLAAVRLARGELPLWNPYAFGGQPGLADIQMAVFYPPQLPFAVAAGPAFSYGLLQWQVLLHLVLAGLGMYLLALRLTRHRVAAVLASLAYSCGGYITSFPIQQLTVLCTAAWLPWAMLAATLQASGKAGMCRKLVALATAVACLVLAGHPQTALLAVYFLTAYGLWRAGMLRAWKEHVVLLVGGIALGLGLCAVQLLPTMEFARHSVRARLSYEQASAGLRWDELIGLLYPGYFGGTPHYLGVLVLLLAVYAVRRRPWREVSFWVISGAAGLALALGGNSPLYALARALLPGFAASRNQERSVLLLAVSASLLSGYGVSSFWGDEAQRGGGWGVQRLLVGLAACAAALYGGQLLPPAAGSDVNVFGGILKQHFHLLWGCLAWAVASFRAAQNRWQGRQAGALLATALFLSLASANWRFSLGQGPSVVSRPSSALAELLREGLASGQRICGVGLPEGPNAGLLYGLPDITGNTPLRLEAVERVLREVGSWRAWQLFAVRYVLAAEPLSEDRGLSLRKGGLPAVYEVLQEHPPAWLVYRTRAAASFEEVLRLLADPGFDPYSEVLVAAGLQPGPLPGSGQGRVRVQRWSEESLDLQVESDADGVLVLSLVHYPGWQATVDGRRERLVSCQGVLTCLRVGAGSHEVKLWYRPLSFAIGLGLSGLSVLACCALVLTGWRLRRGLGG